MSSKNKLQVKIELLCQIDESSNNNNNEVDSQNQPSNLFGYEVTKTLDCLTISSSDYAINQKLALYSSGSSWQCIKSLRIFTNSANNNLIEYIKDGANTIINTLIKGFNVAFITYGESGKKTSNMMFENEACDHINNKDTNLLITVYNQMKRYYGNIFNISVNFLEIWYDHADKTENTSDLLGCSQPLHSKDGNVYSYSLANGVAIKSQGELEALLKIARSRMRYQRQKTDLGNMNDNVIDSLMNSGVLSHVIGRLNFVNVTDNKQFCLYLIDIIDFDEITPNNTLEYLSICHINNLFDELYENKSTIEELKNNKFKNMMKSIELNSNKMNQNMMKITSHLANAILNSQTFILFPVKVYSPKSIQMITQLNKIANLSQVQYIIEKENIDPYGKSNIMSFTYFTKALEFCSKDEQIIEKRIINSQEFQNLNDYITTTSPLGSSIGLNATTTTNSISTRNLGYLSNNDLNKMMYYSLQMNKEDFNADMDNNNNNNTLPSNQQPQQQSQQQEAVVNHYDTKKFFIDISNHPIPETDEEHNYHSYTNSVDSTQKFDEAKDVDHPNNAYGLSPDIAKSRFESKQVERISDYYTTDKKPIPMANTSPAATTTTTTTSGIGLTNTYSNTATNNPITTNKIMSPSLSPSSISSSPTLLFSPKNLASNVNNPLKESNNESLSPNIAYNSNDKGIYNNGSLDISPIDKLKIIYGDNDDNYIYNYNVKVKEITKNIEYIIQNEAENNSDKVLPVEYYLIKRNLEILYELFLEGEKVKTRLIHDFVGLKNKIEDFKSDYDSLIKDLRRENMSLVNKLDSFKFDSGLKDLFDIYENDIGYLHHENQQLRSQNHDLILRLNIQDRPENYSNSAEFNTALMKKHHGLLNEYDQLHMLYQEKDRELNEFKKANRTVIVNKSLFLHTQSKITNLNKTIDLKNDIIANYAQQIESLKKQNQSFKYNMQSKKMEFSRNPSIGKIEISEKSIESPGFLTIEKPTKNGKFINSERKSLEDPMIISPRVMVKSNKSSNSYRMS